MKTRTLPRWASAVAAGGTMLLLAATLRAQPCTLWPDGCQPLPWGGPERYCNAATNWVQAVDLDGDEVTDLWHRRMDVEMRCTSGDSWVLQRDKLEAFYPEPHVDIWAEYYAYSVEFSVPPGELVGDPVLLECAPPLWRCRAWSSEYPPAQPYLQAEGLGYTWRTTDRSPCYDLSCADGFAVGVIPFERGDTFSEVLVGVRIQGPGGWHLGWLKLQWFLDHLPIGHVELADYAIHPEPETPILAGEPPRPTLHANTEGDEIVLNWHPAWTGFVLERSGSVASAAWEEVPGVENNIVRLAKAGPPAFFRLQKE